MSFENVNRKSSHVIAFNHFCTNITQQVFNSFLYNANFCKNLLVIQLFYIDLLLHLYIIVVNNFFDTSMCVMILMILEMICSLWLTFLGLAHNTKRQLSMNAGCRFRKVAFLFGFKKLLAKKIKLFYSLFAVSVLIYFQLILSPSVDINTFIIF